MSTIQDPPMQVLELQYHGDISMYIMLPRNDLSQVSDHCPFPTGEYCVQSTLGYFTFYSVCECMCVTCMRGS